MTTFTPMSIGTEIRNERKRQLYTQKTFSELCGFSQRELSEYESGKRTPSLKRLEEIAKALGKEWRLK